MTGGLSFALTRKREPKGRLIMQLGMVGLGRMGANMVLRLGKAGHQCVVYDRDSKVVADVVKQSEGKATAATSPQDLIGKLSAH